MKGEPPTDNLTLYDHWLALHREIEKPLTIGVAKMTDTDRIEELISDLKHGLAKEIALRDGEPDNEWREVNVLKLDNQIQFLRSLSTTIKDLREKEKLYHELIFGVSKKFPNETRHETALRYIRCAETHENGSAVEEKRLGKEG